jgi:hypothetical protein
MNALFNTQEIINLRAERDALRAALEGMVACFDLSDSPDHADYLTWANAVVVLGKTP